MALAKNSLNIGDYEGLCWDFYGREIIDIFQYIQIAGFGQGSEAPTDG